MFNAKQKKMMIDVTGVDAVTDRRKLMELVVRRNCEVDPRVVDSMVDRVALYGEKEHEKCDYQIALENYDMRGIAKDFELLKAAGIIEHVTKVKCYIVY